jgi:dipicolinate synthase subunit A
MNRIKLCILGGDSRYDYLAKLLASAGAEIVRYRVGTEGALSTLLENCSAVIAPIPYSTDRVHINMEGRVVDVYNLFAMMKECNVKRFICGVADRELLELANSMGIEVYDFFDDEGVALKNAIPTAEGAVMTAMQKSNRTVFGSSSLVLGYGRCGRVLCNTLKGLGGYVYASYRNGVSRAEIYTSGIVPIRLSDVINEVNRFDYIFNTIPTLILNNDILRRVSSDTVIIDLAQAPGGVDYELASELKLNVTYCPGLPARVAPYTAAEILRDAITAIINDCDC